ncbi:MAG: diguanylate cyclase [Nitrospinae bacterium]|nr:diguanylate cyclase [Nitrospinota bacterium]
MENNTEEKVVIAAIDDQEENNLFIHLVLKDESYDVRTSTDSENAVEFIREISPSVILLDVQMPKSGFDICKELKEDENTSHIPVIFISAVHVAVAEIAEGLRIGANDFIKKPFNPVELIARINVALRIKEKEDQIRRMVAIDSLTGLYNRNIMYEFLSKEIERSKRYDEPISLLIIDLDFFKKINDTYGHLAGDQALCHISEIMHGSFRKSDFICRFAGDEFCIIIPNTNEEDALALAKKLNTNVTELPMEFEGKSIEMSVSIGLASRDMIELGFNSDTFINEADSALYAIKKKGRNAVAVFEPGMQESNDNK